MFVLYPALRPWHDESTAAGALAAMSADTWVPAHTFAMIGIILVPLGLLALAQAVTGTPAGRTAITAFVTSAVGSGLVLPYYGAEAFGLHAIATQAVSNPQIDILAMADHVRFDPVAGTSFLAGLLALGIGAALAAVAVWRSSLMPKLSAAPFALGFLTFLPQFFTPAAIRIGHGALVGAGLLWLAAALWRTGSTR
ncbi:hypothetical protein ONA91_16860 [Micromonospora sp. DR5-3]|uniref:hypothetical protein n=1 Tax=unclassified Micromonospora TaxID=2617518 RepID=UPI0011D5AE37|nr:MULTISPECIES: hypothetical protein [unclassified Micromonospora]MCW3816115.1 hypothetical protein [Micromonospora sp. DR5-3]TYC22155.1 hypothetical protein FXF52_22080 [Micromonospora sp. MP36]